MKTKLNIIAIVAGMSLLFSCETRISPTLESAPALLVVDAAQGVEAQTVAVCYTAIEQGLEVLPVLNKEAVMMAIRLGLGINAKIAAKSVFARKNYFYPDLPKGYQVSQHTAPICKGGHVSIQTNDGSRNIRLNRIHIEEDAGKSIHDADEHFTCIDLNRAGVPLLEIVTEPDLHSADEAFAFLTELRKIVRWLHVCDGNMEEGSMRCDANVSVRLHGETKLGKA